MDCFNNTCLSCDRECEGHYCSQACKLADVERGTQSLRSPASPTTTKSSSSSSSSKSWQPPQHSPTDMYSNHRRPQSSYFAWNPAMEPSATSKVPDRILTPSSSRCSLSSTTSSGTSSNDLDAPLQDYFSWFDKAKAAKRRSSTK